MLLQLYWRPVFSYVRFNGRLTSDEAKDLVQAFFTRLLEKRHLEQLTPGKGSFRAFLKRSVKNYMIDRARRRQVRRQVDAPSPGDTQLRQTPAEQDLEAMFDREWLGIVLQQSLAELKRRLLDRGMSEHYQTVSLYCLPEESSSLEDTARLIGVNEQSGSTYQEVAEHLGRSETAVRNQLSYCRKLLRSITREVVLQYVGSPDEVEGELRKILFSSGLSP